METILEQLAQSARERVQKNKELKPLAEVRAEAEAAAQSEADEGIDRAGLLPFERALAQDGISFICEVKKASPSKGLIAEDFDYMSIAREYEEAGAAAISVLTEPTRFCGSDEYLRRIAGEATIPVLRKDFTVDSYMIYEAKILGASAVLLICAILTESELKEYLEICRELNLAALVEAHTESEIGKAVRAGARIIGVNNRDLRTFTVDTGRSIELRKPVPDDILFISESGIRNADQIKELVRNKVDAVLIGETLMRAPDKKKMLDELSGRIGDEKL
jgi:indole-3-glycerol phosphate synthase